MSFQWSSGVTDFPVGSQCPQSDAVLAQGLCPLIPKKGNRAQAAESIFAFLHFLFLGTRCTFKSADKREWKPSVNSASFLLKIMACVNIKFSVKVLLAQ